MEWIRFLLERVNRTEIPSALSFYQRIGWISGEIKADVLEIIRGIGPVAGEPPAGGHAPASASGASAAKDASGDIVIAYGKEQARDLKGPAKGQAAAAKGAPKGQEPATTWRLTPDDHIGSLMYIEWIRSGGDLDRDKLEEIRREVSRLRSGLDGFFSL
jgi:archaellum component FlaD/FlaE